MPMKSSGASSAGGSVLAAAIAVIMAAAGYAAGYSTGSSRAANDAKAEGYREALATVKTKLDASGLFPETRLTSLRGTVRSAGGDAIDIEVAQTVANPLDEPAPLVRHVTLAKDASVVRATPKSDDARFKELEAYEKAAAAARAKGEAPPAAPLSYAEEKISVGDLKPGDTVIVVADGDIARAGSFVATGVRMETGPVGAPSVLAPNAPTPAPTPTGSTTPPPAATTPPPTPIAPPPAAPAPTP